MHLEDNKQKQVILTLNKFSTETGYIYSIDDKSISIFNNYRKELITFSNKEIRYIELEEGVSVLPYSMGGCLFGGITGLLIKGNEPDDLSDVVESSISTVVLVLAGGLAGLLFGTVLGSNTTETVSYNADSQGCFCQLKKYSILQYDIASDQRDI